MALWVRRRMNRRLAALRRPGEARSRAARREARGEEARICSDSPAEAGRTRTLFPMTVAACCSWG